MTLVSPPAGSRPLVPAFLLAHFTDHTGRLMMERRDRARRLATPVDAAVAECGAYRVVRELGGAALARLLDEAEARAARATAEILAGQFPVTGESRACLALFVAFQLLAGRSHREGRVEAGQLIGQIVESRLAELGVVEEPDEDDDEDEEEEEEDGESEEEGEDDAGEDEDDEDEDEDDDETDDDHDETDVAGGGWAPPPPDLELAGEGGGTVALAGLPELARLVAARTWQLLRFPRPLLLTGDTPVVLWARSGVGLGRFGLGGAEEVRLALDPRHALVLARRARLGEVVRDLDERHARALNRTVAEAARQWMFYHPESDPLDVVELAPP